MDRNALIADFVKQYSHGDAVSNEYFRLDLEKLISEICSERASTFEPSSAPLFESKEPGRKILL